MSKYRRYRSNYGLRHRVAPDPACPSCGQAKHLGGLGAVRHGKGVIYAARQYVGRWRPFGRDGSYTRPGVVPDAKPVRLNKKKYKVVGWSTKYAKCNDPFHEHAYSHEEPQPETPRGLKQHSPENRKAKKLRSRNLQNKDRR